METSIEPQIRLDLADETVRRYGEIRVDFPQKMANRIKRKFHIEIDTVTILALVTHFKNIYKFGSSILANFISPSKSKYASLADIKVDDFMIALEAQYPKEDQAIIRAIRDWVIYYEYLR